MSHSAAQWCRISHMLHNRATEEVLEMYLLLRLERNARSASHRATGFTWRTPHGYGYTADIQNTHGSATWRIFRKGRSSENKRDSMPRSVVYRFDPLYTVGKFIILAWNIQACDYITFTCSGVFRNLLSQTVLRFTIQSYCLVIHYAYEQLLPFA
jgi:hypothetical protein